MIEAIAEPTGAGEDCVGAGPSPLLEEGPSGTAGELATGGADAGLLGAD